MADSLDVVGVGVEHEGAVVTGVVDRARAGRAVVDAACRESGRVEGIDELRSAGAEGDVSAADSWAAAPSNSISSLIPSGSSAAS